jgi:hypothetical protein
MNLTKSSRNAQSIKIDARLPVDLAEAVTRYAGEHRCSVGELVREGLQMRLEEFDPLRHLTVAPDVREELTALLREIVQEELTPVVALLRQLQTTLAEVRHREPSVSQREPVVRHRETHAGDPAVDDYDPAKFYLGKLCPRGHEYQGTGKTLLRRHNNGCPQCLNQMKRARRAATKATRQEGQP